MGPNFACIFLGTHSTKNVQIMLIQQFFYFCQIFLVFSWKIVENSFKIFWTAGPNGLKFYLGLPWDSLYQDCSNHAYSAIFLFFPDFLSFSMKNSWKIFSSETAGPNGPKFYLELPWDPCYQDCSNCADSAIFLFLPDFLNFFLKIL